LLTSSANKGNIRFPSVNDDYQTTLTVTFPGNTEYNSLTKSWKIKINKYVSPYNYYLKFYMYPDADHSTINKNELIEDKNGNAILIGVN
jgi:hypothetical protein